MPDGVFIVRLARQGLFYQPPRRARADELVIQKQAPVPFHPLHHVFLAVVVGNQCYAFEDVHHPVI